MKHAQMVSSALAMVLVLTTTGCFRVSSDTRALRDAALESGFNHAEQKIEVGIGFFTVGLAKIARKYVEIPPEARLAISSLKNAECAVYEVKGLRESLVSILAKADTAMNRRGCD